MNNKQNEICKENCYPPTNQYPSNVPIYIIDIQERLGRIETKLDKLCSPKS